MFSDPSAHWVEERRRIREQAERPTTTSLLDQVDHALIFFAGFCNSCRSICAKILSPFALIFMILAVDVGIDWI